jgi:TetR/AcrR family transcriptional repressor of mexJK operon
MSTKRMSKENTNALPGQREKSKAKRRAAIIEIAKRSFLEMGYENTSMSAIALEMGGSKGTLWTYFTSKEELFAAVIENVAAAFQSFTAMALNTENDTPTVLTRFCETFISRISLPEAIAIQRLVVSQAVRAPGLARIFYDRGPAINHNMISNYIGRQMLAGKLRVDDPAEAGKMLLDLCTAGYHDHIFYGLKTPDKETEQREAARVVKQFMRCYGPDGSSK